jgi:MFS family permease
MWAWFLYGFGPLLPLLRAEQHTSRTVVGLHSLLMAFGAIVAGFTTLWLVRRVRRRGAIRLGAVVVVVGSVLLCLGTAPWMTLTAVLIAGIGGSTMINATNPSLSDHHGNAAAAALSEGNAVAAGVGLLAPLAVGAGVAAGLSWRPATLVVVPFAVVILILLGRIPGDTAAMDSLPTPPAQAGSDRLPATFWLLVGLLVACVGIEFCMTAWSADLVAQQARMSPGAASAAVSAVVAGMAVGRLAAGRLALRFSPRRLLLAALALTAAGWLVTWNATAAAPAVLGLALTGVGIAGHFPLAASLIYAALPAEGDRVSRVLSFAVGASAALTPFGMGALADATSTHLAFLVVPVLVVTATGLLLASSGRSAGVRARLSGA